MNISHETNYDPIAEVYLKSTDEKHFTAYYERPFIIANLPDLKGKTVLDLGCGTGYYSQKSVEVGCKLQVVVC